MTIRTELKISGVYIVLAVVSVFFVSLLAFSSSGAESKRPLESGERVITVHDEGSEKGFYTKEPTLKRALKQAGIRLDMLDRTEPSLDEKLTASSYQVNIYRARPVIVRDRGTETKVLSSYRTPHQIAKQAGIELQEEDAVVLSSSRDVVAEGAAEIMSINRATAFDFVFYGKSSKGFTMADTVGEMLKQKNIVLAENDRVMPGLDVQITEGMSIELWREGKQTITEEKEIDFDIEQIKDVDKPIGFREVKTPGVKGMRTVTYEIVIKNGKEESRKEVNSNTTKQPVKQVEIVGGKNNYSGSLNEWLLALRTCETGGNYAAATGNGYYGAYQFLPSTWNSIARKTGRIDLVGVMPHVASPADQDAMVIANTNMTAGLSTQHPGCYKKLGLSNKPPA